MTKDHGRVGLMICWHVGYNAVPPPLLGFLASFLGSHLTGWVLYTGQGGMMT